MSACGESDVVVGADRKYLLERVGEVAVVQLYADGFERLPVRNRILCWHLYQAAIAGRDIYYDQRYAYNLEMRAVLEAILTHADGIDRAVLDAITRYTKLFWVNTGPFNNITARKFVPDFTPADLASALHTAIGNGASIGGSAEDLLTRLHRPFFDRDFEPIVTNKSPGQGQDILEASANNLYVGVSMDAIEGITERHPLNSRLVNRDGQLVEEVYRVGGKYSAEIARIAAHLEAASQVAPAPTAEALTRLARFYRTGEIEDRRQYDIAWVADNDSTVDTINGFIEVYMDARGVKGAWESLVYYVHPEKTAAVAAIASHAQWFEDRMPWDPMWRKPRVTGVSARAIEVIVEAGDSGPVTPVGINLPNDQQIRETYGSKSVSLSNVAEAYDKSTPKAFRTEFSSSADEVERAERWGAFASELTTNLHEIIGHGSGLVSESLKGAPEKALKEHFSAIEEARADLVALYFVADSYLVELGVVAAEAHQDVIAAEYQAYARNALVQLRRIREGSQIEEDHMRNRQLIVHWLLANTDAIRIVKQEGKTFYRVVGVNAFRDGAGRLLGEVQRIKAEGDYEAARELLDTYGVYVDPDLRDEVVRRVDALDLSSYTAFVMPKLEPVVDEQGTVIDVRVSYPLDFAAQMLEYRRRHGSSMFSSRVPGELGPNTLASAVERMRLSGDGYDDLTLSNPTEAAIDYPPDLLAPLADAASLKYDPQPFGLHGAREAVAADYRRRGLRVPASHVILTASSSESYTLLFKLLCDAGDSVLVPTPSYPLFEHLTRLDGVRALPYATQFHGTWAIDLDEMRYAVDERTRAILVVSPNNPTGGWLKRDELAALVDLCRAHHLALVGDEVFCDYPIDPAPGAVRSVLEQNDVLTVALGGLSKSVGLPQLKLGWMAIQGPARLVQSAVMRLELIADTYLSVATPVQVAASQLLEQGQTIRSQIRHRILQNYHALQQVAGRHEACQVLRAEGGWSAVLRVPHTMPEDERVIQLLEQDHVLVHPGYFFDFPRDGYLVVSLLPRPDVFRSAAERLLATVGRA